MNLSEGKCNVLHLEWINPMPRYKLGQTASKGRKGPGGHGGGQAEHKLAVCPCIKDQLCSEHLHRK